MVTEIQFVDLPMPIQGAYKNWRQAECIQAICFLEDKNVYKVYTRDSVTHGLTRDRWWWDGKGWNWKVEYVDRSSADV